MRVCVQAVFTRRPRRWLCVAMVAAKACTGRGARAGVGAPPAGQAFPLVRRQAGAPPSLLPALTVFVSDASKEDEPAPGLDIIQLFRCSSASYPCSAPTSVHAGVCPAEGNLSVPFPTQIIADAFRFSPGDVPLVVRRPMLTGSWLCPAPRPSHSLPDFVSRVLGLPRWLSGKESACQCRRPKRCRFDPWVGKMPWRRAWPPTPVFLPGKSHGQRSLVGYSPWGQRLGHDRVT